MRHVTDADLDQLFAACDRLAATTLWNTRREAEAWLAEVRDAGEAALQEARTKAADARSIRHRAAPVARTTGGISYPTRPRRR